MYQLTLTFDEQNQIVHAAVQGALTTINVFDMYNEIIERCRSANSDKILIDVRESKLAFQSLDVVDIMHELQAILADYKVARVIQDPDVNNGLIETYSEQHKINIKNFESYQQAMQWLKT